MTTLAEELVRHSAGIQNALDAGEDDTPLAEVFRAVLEQEAFLWTWGESGIVALVRDYPLTGRRECLVWLGWGKMEDIEAGLPVVEVWAKASGCDNVCIFGRKGWERSFLTRSQGYRPVTQLYIKELT